jgi:hypothetical protein
MKLISKGLMSMMLRPVEPIANRPHTVAIGDETNGHNTDFKCIDSNEFINTI